MSFLLLIHAFATFFMTGLIWVIQFVHYPSFRFYDPQNFSKNHKFHSTRITFIVLPIMFLELVTGFAIVNLSYFDFDLFNFSLFCLILIWISTFLVQIPIHQKLSHQFDENMIIKLIHSNWIRTILWSIRSLIIIIELKKYV